MLKIALILKIVWENKSKSFFAARKVIFKYNLAREQKSPAAPVCF